MAMISDSNPMLRYNTDPTEEELRAANSPAERIMSGLTWAILIVCLGFWAVVGAIFWVPLLLRTMFRFSLALVGAMLAGRKPERAAQMLRDAVSFYRRGFQVAIEVVLKHHDEEAPKAAMYGQQQREDVSLQGMPLLNELAWVFVIWYGILLFLGFVETTPIDLFWRLTLVDWTETFVRPVAEFIRGLTA